jgi:hypothetical protein
MQKSNTITSIFIYIDLCNLLCTDDIKVLVPSHNNLLIILSQFRVATIRRGLDWMIGFIELIHSTRNYK